jgi:hypothetical protein
MELLAEGQPQNDLAAMLGDVELCFLLFTIAGDKDCDGSLVAKIHSGDTSEDCSAGFQSMLADANGRQ